MKCHLQRKFWSWAQWHTLANPVLKRLRQENTRFETSLGHLVRTYLRALHNTTESYGKGFECPFVSFVRLDGTEWRGDWRKCWAVEENEADVRKTRRVGSRWSCQAWLHPHSPKFPLYGLSGKPFCLAQPDWVLCLETKSINPKSPNVLHLNRHSLNSVIWMQSRHM